MIENKSYQITFNIIYLFIAIIMILPLVLLFVSSITDNNALIANGYSFFPAKLSLEAYGYMLTNSSTIVRAYMITIIVTALGTFIGLAITTMMSFALSIRNLPGNRIISFLVFFTMLFNGGLVPSYIMWTNLGVVNTIWAYVFPFFLTNAFNIVLIRSYFVSSIPKELYESAKIDGAGYFRVFFKMALPLGKPIIATVGLFSCLLYWNDWLNGLYFITDPSLYSIQALLNRMSQNIQSVINSSASSTSVLNLPQASIRMAIAFVAILPILVLYPFIQKYFANGIMKGAIKG